MRARLTAFFEKNRFSILVIVLIWLGSGVFTFFYVSSEKALYAWDNDAYQTLTGDLIQQFQVSFGAGIRFIIDATQTDYNAYFCLPLLPILLITGNSRQTFEIALVIIFFLPFILVTGLIGRKLIDGNPRRVFWLVVGLGLALPAVWLPTLRGYPDVAASLALALAILLYLKDPSLKRITQLISLGLLIGLAILIRRHFAYSAFAFFGAAGIVALVRFAREARYQFGKAVRKLVERVFQLGLAGVFTVLIVAVFNLQIILKVIYIDYNKLYSSYLEPWSKVFGWFMDSYGWLTFGGAIAGLYLVWRKSSRKEEVLFFGLFSSFELIIWVVYTRQISIQYTLHLSVFIIIGLAGLFLNVWEKLKTSPRPRLAQAAAALGVVFLCVNGLSGFVLPTPSFPAALFTGNWHPMQRDDYQQVINLTKYLNEQTTWDDRIYVIASSYRFNAQTFLRADEALTGRKNDPGINLLTSPDIDSRDFYPLETLLESAIVVLIDPWEYHISPDQQQVVKVVFDMFKKNRGLAQDYTVLYDNYFLDNQTKATVFKRVRATPVVTALKSLQIMQGYLKEVPGTQADWINFDPEKPATIIIRENDGTGLVLDRSKWKANPSLPATQDSSASDMATSKLIYARPLTGKEVFQGKINFSQADCGEAVIDFSGVDPEKAPLQFAEFKAKPNQNPPFQVHFANVPTGQFVVIAIIPPPADCTVTLELEPVK